MSFKGGCFDTDSTFIAMGVGVGTANAANAALLTMILSFVLIVQKDANRAPICTQDNIAMGAGLRSRLHCVAVGALNCFYSMAIHGVSFLRIFFILVM